MDISPLGRNRTEFSSFIMIVNTILAPYMPVSYQRICLPVSGMERVGNLKSFCSILAWECS